MLESVAGFDSLPDGSLRVHYGIHMSTLFYSIDPNIGLLMSEQIGELRKLGIGP